MLAVRGAVCADLYVSTLSPVKDPRQKGESSALSQMPASQLAVHQHAG